MALEWEQTVVDAHDPQVLGRWWAEALDWVVVGNDPEEFEIRETKDRLPGILFGRDDETKSVKNRLHFDFRPKDRDAEVERLLRLRVTSARPVRSPGCLPPSNILRPLTPRPVIWRHP